MDRRAAVTVEVTNVDVQVAAARRRVRRTDPDLAWVPARSRCVGAVTAARSAQRGVVGRSQSEPDQVEDGADQPRGPAQCQAATAASVNQTAQLPR